jgi:membrane-associated protein
VLASVTSWLLHLHGPVVYAVVGLLVFLELAIVIGFFIPGEISAIVGGVIASQHHAEVVAVAVIVVVAATAGNVAGYEVGRLVGPWLFSHRPLAGQPGVVRAQHLVARRGGPAVVLGRFVVVVRAVLPGLVGMSGMRRRPFFLFSAAGAVVWGTLWVTVGFVVGLSYSRVTDTVGPVAAGLVALLVVGWMVMERRRRRARRNVPAPPDDQ